MEMKIPSGTGTTLYGDECGCDSVGPGLCIPHVGIRFREGGTVEVVVMGIVDGGL